MSTNSGGQCQNTDKEIWSEREDDYYADRIFVTERGSIGINCGGSCIVMPIREWFKLAGGNRINVQQAQSSASSLSLIALMEEQRDLGGNVPIAWRDAFEKAIAIIRKHEANMAIDEANKIENRIARCKEAVENVKYEDYAN